MSQPPQKSSAKAVVKETIPKNCDAATKTVVSKKTIGKHLSKQAEEGPSHAILRVVVTEDE